MPLRLGVRRIAQHRNICRPLILLKRGLGNITEQNILIRRLVVQKPESVLYVGQLRFGFFSGQVAHQHRRQVDARLRHAVAHAAVSEVHLVEIDRPAAVDQLDVDHAVVAERRQHGNQPIAHRLERVERTDLSEQGDALLVLGDAQLFEQRGQNHGLTEADARDGVLLLNRQHLLHEHRPPAHRALQAVQLVCQRLARLTHADLALESARADRRLAEAREHHVVRNDNLIRTQVDLPCRRSVKSKLLCTLDLNCLVHLPRDRTLSAVLEVRHDVVRRERIAVLIDQRGGVVVGREQHLLSVVFSGQLDQPFDQFAVLPSELLDRPADIPTGGGDVRSALLSGHIDQGNRIPLPSEGADDAERGRIIFSQYNNLRFLHLFSPAVTAFRASA